MDLLPFKNFLCPLQSQWITARPISNAFLELYLFATKELLIKTKVCGKVVNTTKFRPILKLCAAQ